MSRQQKDKIAGTREGLDDLLERAKQLQKRAGGSPAAAPAGTDSAEVLQSINRNLGEITLAARNMREGYMGFHERVLRPVRRVFGPPLGWIFRWYRRLWRRFAYTDDRNTGGRVLSRRKSGIMIGLTLMVLAALTPTRIGDAIRFFTVEPVTDTALMLTSKRTEVFYLNNAEEIDPEINEYAVRGCRTQGECSEADAVYFRIKPRLAHDLWKLLNYGNPIYVPDHVVAPIAPGVNRCSVVYYGYRMTSSWFARILRSFQIYPVMLEASCSHIRGASHPE